MAVFLGYNQYWPEGFMVLWFLCQGTPEGSGSGLKRLRRRATAKVSSDRLREAGKTQTACSATSCSQ